MAKAASTKSIAKPIDDWQVESDLRTLIECEVIEKDPKRLAAAQALAKKKMLDMASIASDSKAD